MARERKTLSDRIAKWRVLLGNLPPDLDEFPALDGEVDELKRIHAETTTLIAEVTLLRGKLLGSTARLRALARRGDMLRTRVGAVLRGSLGYDSTRLVQYGFRPRASGPSDDVRPAGPAEMPGSPSEPEPS